MFSRGLCFLYNGRRLRGIEGRHLTTPLTSPSSGQGKQMESLHFVRDRRANLGLHYWEVG